MGKVKEVFISDKDAPNALAKDVRWVLEEVTKKTGFVVKEEIFRGKVHATYTLSTIIYRGTYKGKRAVLKLQGLMIETSELDMINAFERQNKSRIIHAPAVYEFVQWSREKGYGYMISEDVGTKHIYELPFASHEQMSGFCSFYQEYRTKAITSPWVESKNTSLYAGFVLGDDQSKTALSAVKGAVGKWKKDAESRGRLKPGDYNKLVERFNALADSYVPRIPVSFMHRELTAQHIFVMPDGSYRLTSNLLWGYRLRWADLAYNIWKSILEIRDTNYTFEELRVYIEDWIAAYKAIPIVKAENDFDKIFRFVLLERVIGIILGDLGSGEQFESEESKKHLVHLFELNRRLFDYLADMLEK